MVLAEARKSLKVEDPAVTQVRVFINEKVVPTLANALYEVFNFDTGDVSKRATELAEKAKGLLGSKDAK